LRPKFCPWLRNDGTRQPLWHPLHPCWRVVSIRRMLVSMAATCSLAAFPLPVMLCFTRLGAYSTTLRSFCKAAAIATPCARPSFNMLCTFLPKNCASMASSSGKCRSMISVVLLKMARSFSVWSSPAGNRMAPASSKRRVAPSTESTPKPMTVVPGSIPRMMRSTTGLLLAERPSMG
jgi:hypothetical protein